MASPTEADCLPRRSRPCASGVQPVGHAHPPIRFFMSGANHRLDIFSGYPFDEMAEAWKPGFDPAKHLPPSFGDTVIGHDVWIGNGATILPGITVGDGAVIGTDALVSKDVPPFAIVVGNPARLFRYRFDPDTVAELQRIAWWDWSVAKITRNLEAVRASDLTNLRDAR